MKGVAGQEHRSQNKGPFMTVGASQWLLPVVGKPEKLQG